VKSVSDGETKCPGCSRRAREIKCSRARRKLNHKNPKTALLIGCGESYKDKNSLLDSGYPDNDAQFMCVLRCFLRTFQ
jgi:hypothetical protein